MSELIYRQYLGVVSLLGRVSTHADLSHEDRECIARAMRDANAVLRGRASEIVFARCAPRGWAAFERSQVKP